MSLEKKLQSIRKSLGLTQEALAAKLGITRPSYASYEEGRAIPRLQILRQICQFSGIEIEELVGDDLGMVRPARGYVGSAIPLIPIKATAGYQAGFPDEQFVSELPHLYLPTLGKGDYRAFEISGDSMLPLAPGTIVIGERVEKVSEIKNGKTYVMVTKTEGVVYKRVFNYINDNGQLFLVSDNPIYKPYSLDAAEINEAWMAKAYISVQFPEGSK